MNKQLFKVYMFRVDRTQAELADAMGISRATLSAKLNGKARFKTAELEMIKNRYGITKKDFDRIFFDK